MKSKKLFLSPFIFFFSVLSFSNAATKQAYSITVELGNATGIDKIYLQAYYGKTLTALDSLSFSSNKANTFTGSNALQPGMYCLTLTNKPLVNFFISDSINQKFTIALDLCNSTQSLSFANSPENQALINYLRFLGEQQHIPNAQATIMQKGSELIQQFPNSMLALFIQTLREPVIPATNHSSEKTQEYVFNYYIDHYFDNIDFSDQRLLNTPLLEQKLETFFKQLVAPQANSAIEKINFVVAKAIENDEVYNWTVRYLYKLYREAPIPENTRVYNFIGENYIVTAPNRWADTAFVEKVKTRVAKSKLNPIGERVTNLILKTADGKTQELYKIKANYTILFFYNPTCEACQPVSEALAKKYAEFKSKGVEVFAVYMDNQKEEWQNYIAAKNLNWINVYNPSGSADIEEKHDLYALPMIYLLDKDHRTIAKDITASQLEKYFTNE